jgi:chemotaxis protein MotB
MKKTFLFIACMILAVGILSTSCVPTRKLVASQARVGKMQQDSAYAVSQMNDCNAMVKNLTAENVKIQNQNASMEIQNANMRNENAAVQNDLTALTAKSKMTIEDQAERLKTFQDIIQGQNDIMMKLKKSIADALINYKTDELYVYIKDGSVYVSLEEKLLFKSGSDVVDPKGKAALKTLAQVLNSTKDINVLIEGHTDNVPIKTSKFNDNWDLSTARANSIVRILTVDNGFDSNRITSSGKGQFHPIKTNDTAEGRSDNRRTEVILSPDLQELYTLLYQ